MSEFGQKQIKMPLLPLLLLGLLLIGNLGANCFSMMAPATKSPRSSTSTTTTTTTQRSTTTVSTTMTKTLATTAATTPSTNDSSSNHATNNIVATTMASPIGGDSISNSTRPKHWEESGESEESVEFLDTFKGDKLVKGEKVMEVRTPWNTHLGDDDAEATE